MTVLPIIQKMINQTKDFKQNYPRDSRTHGELKSIELILVDVFEQITSNHLNSHSYNDNI